MIALEAILSAFQKAHSPCSATDTKARSLEQLIGIKEAELYALEDLIRWQSRVHDGLCHMRPDLFVERLAELVLLRDYTGQLSESFKSLMEGRPLSATASTTKNTHQC